MMIPNRYVIVVKEIIKLLLLLIFLIVVFSAVLIVIRVFADRTIDTTPLTNIGFAMAVSMASVCFSWYKVFKAEDVFNTLRIQVAGQEFLLVAATFAFASFFKYIDLHPAFVPMWVRTSAILNFIYQGTFWVSICLSVFLFVDALALVLNLLYDNHWKHMEQVKQIRREKKKMNSQI